MPTARLFVCSFIRLFVYSFYPFNVFQHFNPFNDFMP